MQHEDFEMHALIYCCYRKSVLLMDLGTIIKQANSKNCGPSPSNKFDLEVGQRSRSSHGTNRKGFSQGSCMPNINALSLILQKI